MVWTLEILEDNGLHAGEAASPSDSQAEMKQPPPPCAAPQLELGQSDPAMAASAMQDATSTPIAEPGAAQEELDADQPAAKLPKVCVRKNRYLFVRL